MSDTLLCPPKGLLLDGRVKGMPSTLPPTPMEQIGQMGWSLLGPELPTPLAVLDIDAIETNSQWFKAVTSRYGVSLCPHGKTTMAPQLFHKQLKDGAWGITLATQHQVAVARSFGINRIFIANQILDPAFLRWLAQEQAADPAFDAYFLIDSPEGVAAAAKAAAETAGHRPFQVLIEMGSAAGRTGLRTQEEALDLARLCAQHARALRLCGVEGFEGAIRASDALAIEAAVTEFLHLMMRTAAQIEAEGLFFGPEILLTAGGSAYFDLVARNLTQHSLTGAVRVVLRSGCYITHDAQHYDQHVERAMIRSPELGALPERPRQALTVWATVQSRPGPEVFYINAGRRDLSADSHLPRLLAYVPDGKTVIAVDQDQAYQTTLMWDQHSAISCPPDSPIRPGIKVQLGISHPCTTFDKWATILLIDSQLDVKGALKTWF